MDWRRYAYGALKGLYQMDYYPAFERFFKAAPVLDCSINAKPLKISGLAYI